MTKRIQAVILVGHGSLRSDSGAAMFRVAANLRDQIGKLKEELSLSKRLDWIRRGLYGSTPKAAEKLKQPLVSTNKNFDLNVELHQNGAVNVKPATNAPAPAPAPAATPK